MPLSSHLFNLLAKAEYAYKDIHFENIYLNIWRIARLFVTLPAQTDKGIKKQAGYEEDIHQNNGPRRSSDDGQWGRGAATHGAAGEGAGDALSCHPR